MDQLFYFYCRLMLKAENSVFNIKVLISVPKREIFGATLRN